MRSFHVHVEFLLCSPGLQVVNFILLVVQSCLPLSFVFLLTLEIELLVSLSDVIENIALRFLEIIFQHSSHTVELVGLSCVHLIL